MCFVVQRNLNDPSNVAVEEAHSLASKRGCPTRWLSFGYRLSYSLGFGMFALAWIHVPGLHAQGQVESSFLQRFRADPHAAMQELPEKRIESGQLQVVKAKVALEMVGEVGARFSPRDRLTRARPAEGDLSRLVEYKQAQRLEMCTPAEDGQKRCFGELAKGKASIDARNRPEDLVDRPEQLEFHLKTLTAQIGFEGFLDDSPWSDDYWPLYKGMLGARYADPAFFQAGFDFPSYLAYVTERPASSVWAFGLEPERLRLSPSEKYDLLLGDDSFQLTKIMWERGQKYLDALGKVESWMGVCHGWAAASYLLERPENAVKAVTPSGEEIIFYPSDIKALASLLYAEVRLPTRFIGRRCYERQPERAASGRPYEPECLDINPGTWHVSVLHQIGRVGRSFIMDATFDYEVWNQPVYGFEYQWFHPSTFETVESIEQAKVDIEEFTQDTFSEFRSEQAVDVVGVRMRVYYMNESQPSHAWTVSSEDDVIVSVDYHYDLELDAEGRIVGGEWYTIHHPDFLWNVPIGSLAKTPADRFTSEDWQPAEPVPASFRRFGPWLARYGMPLPAVVHRLFEQAQYEQAQ